MAIIIMLWQKESAYNENNKIINYYKGANLLVCVHTVQEKKSRKAAESMMFSAIDIVRPDEKSLMPTHFPLF